MTAHSVGYLIGSLVSGLLFDRFNKILLIFSSVFGNAVTIGIIPWCSRYELMIVIHWVKGLFSGSLDAGKIDYNKNKSDSCMSKENQFNCLITYKKIIIFFIRSLSVFSVAQIEEKFQI